jgi:hypothetical protein
MAINLKLTRINVETFEICLAKGLISPEETFENLGSQIHDTRVRVGKEPINYTSGEESVWEGIAGMYGKVDSMEGRIRADIMSEIKPRMSKTKIEATPGTAALVQREVALLTWKMMSQLQAVRREHSVTVSSLETELARLLVVGISAALAVVVVSASTTFRMGKEM